MDGTVREVPVGTSRPGLRPARRRFRRRLPRRRRERSPGRAHTPAVAHRPRRRGSSPSVHRPRPSVRSGTERTPRARCPPRSSPRVRHRPSGHRDRVPSPAPPADTTPARNPDCRTRSRTPPGRQPPGIAATAGGGATACGWRRALAVEHRGEEGVALRRPDLTLERVAAGDARHLVGTDVERNARTLDARRAFDHRDRGRALGVAGHHAIAAGRRERDQTPRRLHRIGLVRRRRAEAEIEFALRCSALERGIGQCRHVQFGAGRHRDPAGGDLDHCLSVRLGPECVALDDGKIQRRRVPLVLILGMEGHRAADLGQPAHARRRIAALLVLCSRRPQRVAVRPAPSPAAAAPAPAAARRPPRSQPSGTQGSACAFAKVLPGDEVRPSLSARKMAK